MLQKNAIFAMTLKVSIEVGGVGQSSVSGQLPERHSVMVSEIEQNRKSELFKSALNKAPS